MWPILYGFIVGMAAHSIYWIVRDRRPSLPDHEPQTDPRREGLLDLIWLAFGALFLLIVIACWHATSSLESIGSYRQWLWLVFFGSTFGSFVLGTAVGLIGASWYRESRDAAAQNLSLRGTAVGFLALIVVLFGLNNEYAVFDRVSKISASVVSIELDKAARGDRVEVQLSSPSIAPRIWAANERIEFALFILKDLGTKALDLDRQALRYLAPGAGDRVIEENRDFATRHLLPMISLREEIHQAKRDTGPLFFDSEKIEQAGLALALRDLLLMDVGRDGRFDDSREERVARLADAYGAYAVSTRYNACVLGIKSRDIKELEKTRDTLQAGMKERRDDVRRAAGSRKADAELRLQKALERSAEVEASLMAETKKEEALCVRLASRKHWPEQVERESKILRGLAPLKGEVCDSAEPCRNSIPSQATVQSSPYLAIVAAIYLYAAGEREAAVSLLDLWRRKAAVEDSSTSKVRERLFAVRVLNLTGLLLGDLSNGVVLEIGTHYQQGALEESTALIDGHDKLRGYAAEHKFPVKDGFDLLTAAARPISDRRNLCTSETAIPEAGPRYVVFRRSTLLNNVVYFLSSQFDLLQQPGMSDKFDRLVEELRSLRVDCLANMAADAPTVGAEWEELRADMLVRTLDTLARALKTQSRLKEANGQLARQPLCDAYRAAVYAERLAGIDKPQTLDRATFRASSFQENGKAISDFSDVRSARKLVRELKESITGLGEGACRI